MATKKTATKTTPSRRKTGPRVSVRMYRQGLGDCFLLTFPDGTGKPFYMLIDCGVVLGTPDAMGQMKKVLQDILTVTRQIDLLVVTHEHWDHVSGFVQVQDQFDQLKIKAVWVAWTEDPTDALAKKLRAERRGAEDALRMAVCRLAVGGDNDTAQRVNSLVDFFGARSGSTTDALDYAKGRAPQGKPRYCTPGEPPIAIDQVPGVRFWVLGPPKNEKLIKKSNPGKGDAYGLDAGPGGSQSFLMSGLARNMHVDSDAAPSADFNDDPFDIAYAIPLARAEQMPFFQQAYYGPSADESLFDRSSEQAVRDQSWRRIDLDWMGASETMALQLDSATNNTSLVLAIELVPSGEVLLFPGDAQAGNWLSWQDLKWEIKDKDAMKTVSGPELLARTIFYKVGHHGSHNATLKAKGLEMMLSDQLIAMIPVDHEMAVKKGWGRMPLPDLLDRIEDKTHGRVLRVDDQVKAAGDLSTLKPATVSAKEWKTFTDRLKVTEVYYEVSF